MEKKEAIKEMAELLVELAIMYDITHLPTGLMVWTISLLEGNAKQLAHSLCQQFAQIAPQYDKLTLEQAEQMRDILRNL